MSSDSTIVKLNIGGTKYQTTKSTLTKFDGFFRTILETEIPVIKDETGAIFIDRNPKHFAAILDFMRNGHVELPESGKELKELRNEAQYYLLEGLVELCEPEKLENVKLNIGGTVFEAPRSILKKFEFFRNKCAGNEIFIERDPKFFNYILGFMNSESKLPVYKEDLKKLANEAKFYQIFELETICREKIVEGECLLKFNVGGREFKAKEKDFRRQGTFYHLLRQEADENGYIVINRSPKHFQFILEYASGNYHLIHLPMSLVTLNEIMEEARFYSLDTLQNDCFNMIVCLQQAIRRY